MTPFIILLVCWGSFRLAGRLGIGYLNSTQQAGRAALAVMFAFTGATHFSSMKHDYLTMIPDVLPGGLSVIYLTGGLEIVGGLGLLFHPTRRVAAAGLIVLLLAIFPANVNASINNITFRGESATALWLRGPMQFIFLLAVWWSALRKPPAGEGAHDDEEHSRYMPQPHAESVQRRRP